MLKAVSRFLRVSLFFFWGRCGPAPRRCHMFTIYGQIAVPKKVDDNPTEEAIDELHGELLQKFEDAFNKHKVSCGQADQKLVFI
jgi:hypothetical protein